MSSTHTGKFCRLGRVRCIFHKRLETLEQHALSFCNLVSMLKMCSTHARVNFFPSSPSLSLFPSSPLPITLSPPPLPTSLYEALEIYNSGKLGPGYIASFNTVLIPSYYSLHHVRSLHFSEVLESVTDFCSAWSQGHSVSSERQQAPCQKKVPRRRRRLSEGLRKRMGLLNIQSPSQQSKWSRLFAG